jgi:two-component system chemotaxis sensor kinase CheA
MTPQPNAALLKKLTGFFLVEAREHVQALGAGLLELEQAPDREAQLPIVERMFRAAHSLKGAARTVTAGEIERLCQTLESGLSELKFGKSECTAELLKGLHRDAATLGVMIDALEARQEPAAATAPVASASPQPMITERAPPPAASPPAAARLPNQSADTVRIAIDKLDSIFVLAEEMLAVKLHQNERGAELEALLELTDEQNRRWDEAMPWVRALRQQIEGQADTGLTRLLGWLEQERKFEDSVHALMQELAQTMTRDRHRFAALADHLLEDVKRTLMLPFSTILAGFPKMVHDLADEASKQIEFAMHGTGIEIDKRILEQIKDPLVHLIRNAVDHGIEPPHVRSQARKPRLGRLTLTITQAAGKAEILLADDGAGIDVEVIKLAAVEAGLIAADEAAAMSDQDARHLVFRSGVTSRQQVTALSGRGLGMSIVQEHVTKLGGTVAIESQIGTGTSFRITLPLTLATLRGTLVRVANREFVIPTVHVIRCLRVPQSAVKRVENRDCVVVDGAPLALAHLAEMLGLNPQARNSTAPLTLLILGHGQIGVAFEVDEVVSEQEMLAKPLGPLLLHVQNLAGATVVGTGGIAPILSVPDLMQTATGSSRTTVPTGLSESTRAKRLLVVDDSITVRTSLQSLLESAGFDIKTAPDGAAAFKLLQTNPFDLVVSDVEMPRMDGFELTRRIRNEPQLAHLPVVLVTARETADDRLRGLDAGANAYLTKSGFDQTNLLESLKQLL